MSNGNGRSLVKTNSFYDEHGTCYMLTDAIVLFIARIYGAYSERESRLKGKNAHVDLRILRSEMIGIMRVTFSQFKEVSARDIAWVTWDIFEEQVFRDAYGRLADGSYTFDSEDAVAFFAWLKEFGETPLSR